MQLVDIITKTTRQQQAAIFKLHFIPCRMSAIFCHTGVEAENCPNLNKWRREYEPYQLQLCFGIGPRDSRLLVTSLTTFIMKSVFLCRRANRLLFKWANDGSLSSDTHCQQYTAR